MTDLCETCGWYASEMEHGCAPEEFKREAAPALVDLGQCRRLPHDIPVTRDYWCSQHTAVRRRRIRLMLAWQVAEGIVKGDSHESYAAIAKSCIEIAQASLTIADAILDRADER